MDGKTSTFTIYHDHCDPSKWTAADVLTLAKFIQFGNMEYAASLARLGVQLVTSEHHEPKGGHLEEIGFGHPDPSGEYVDNIDEVDDDADYFPFCRIYRGPIEYAIRIPIGDASGEFDGYEIDTKPTEAEAAAYVKGMYEAAE